MNARPLLAVAISAVVGVGLAELGARVFATPFPSPAQLRARSLLYTASSHGRPELLPLDRVVSPRHGVTWRINEDGLRGRRVTGERRDGVTRLLVMGGSAAFDLGASDPRDWPHLVGAALSTSSAPVEVLNAAVPGHSTRDSVGRLRSRIEQWRPDVLLLYHGWNDLKELPLAVTPTHSFLPNPLLQEPAGALSVLVEHSQLVRRLRHAWLSRAIGAQGLEGARPAVARDTFDRGAGLARLRSDLHSLAELCQVHGVELVLVRQARLVTADLCDADRKRVDYAALGLLHESVLAAWTDHDKVLREVADHFGLTLLDAHASMGAAPASFEDHVHLTRGGAERLARYLVTALRPVLQARSGIKGAAPGSR